MILSCHLPDEWEEGRLAVFAARSRKAQRSRPEDDNCPYRTAFQRDRDRIVHCKAFRRLAHKTQVFIASTGDHFRTRLTHTLEVSQIARTLARALRLNEDLTEAAALGHDLGHTPFGHAGEKTLDSLVSSGFRHQEQSLRLVDILEKNGQGLNLTLEVRDGILKHSKGFGPIFVTGTKAPLTLEGQLVRVADIIAYLAHDLDDALSAFLIAPKDVPIPLVEKFGSKASSRIRVMVDNLLNHSWPENNSLTLGFSVEMEEAMEELRTFLYNNVYRHPKLVEDLFLGEKVITAIFKAYMNDDRLYQSIEEKVVLGESRERVVTDFIAGMTDRYALDLYQKLV